jgi:hypothetical protein
VTGPLTAILAFGCLGFALWVAFLMSRDKQAGPRTLAAAAALELGFIVQAVLGVVLLITTDQDVSGVLFVAYLVGSLLVLPAAVWWAAAERRRWGPAGLAAAGLVNAVLLARLQDIWQGRA